MSELTKEELESLYALISSKSEANFIIALTAYTIEDIAASILQQITLENYTNEMKVYYIYDRYGKHTNTEYRGLGYHIKYFMFSFSVYSIENIQINSAVVTTEEEFIKELCISIFYCKFKYCDIKLTINQLIKELNVVRLNIPMKYLDKLDTHLLTYKDCEIESFQDPVYSLLHIKGK